VEAGVEFGTRRSPPLIVKSGYSAQSTPDKAHGAQPRAFREGMNSPSPFQKSQTPDISYRQMAPPNEVMTIKMNNKIKPRKTGSAE
jgi:hypothetical protein